MGVQVIFNDIVAYEKQHARLYNINEPEKSVNLYTPTNECLSLLIETWPDVISQHVFFEKVWENKGLPITANTFYQHIAILRRAFEEVGLNKEAIVTTPRKGLSLAATLDIKFEEMNDPLSNDKPAENTLSLLQSGNGKHNHFIRWTLFLLGGTLVFSVFFGLSYAWFPKAIDQKSELENYRFLGEVGHCRVFTYSSLSTLSEVDNDLKNNRIQCKAHDNIYYST